MRKRIRSSALTGPEKKENEETIRLRFAAQNLIHTHDGRIHVLRMHFFDRQRKFGGESKPHRQHT